MRMPKDRRYCRVMPSAPHLSSALLLSAVRRRRSGRRF
ncbi:hypothetical protein FM104_16220 [Microbacterium esteraromaticum]|uniref:Uncharacterized protein n=1 Tax=Microbacterium esteraromaticum TaxID=57043 RepID=A0A1R4KT40_9MICO|nr:hypothetical protein FM104_16220 [Microbacterium esteraromaticum]